MKKSVFAPADILLPRGNFESWSVIACDQFTSNEEYWEETARLTAGVPSTRHMIYPEVYLGKSDAAAVTASINAAMQEYLDRGVYTEYPDALIYVERVQPDGRVRAGLVGAVDLDAYEYTEGSHAAIRATEKTVLERIPPRVEVRKNAPTELPHVLMLLDDAERTVIEPLAVAARDGNMQTVYDFDLMQGGGHLTGYLVPRDMNADICARVEALGEKHGGMTMAVGDGNHSLATAKACRALCPTEINRYALCELVNIHSDALSFEPIYRTVENVDTDALLEAFLQYVSQNTNPANKTQTVTFVTRDARREITVEQPPHALAVGTVQLFLDAYLPTLTGAVIDYIHGEDEVAAVVKKDNACGFLYDCMGKSELFDAVEREGALPRKTFSMGHARDKRYYTEVRRIK
ncbi:MAG: DUF1015 domain-containing protein [Clostridia bacterium]|nr:DUF1015 domain-containing protein [Clostridia bacterium]